MASTLTYPLEKPIALLHMTKQRLNARGHVMIAYDIVGELGNFKIYQCARCNTFFSSFAGSEYHTCSSPSYRTTVTEVYDKFLDFVCCNNISERAATDSYLRTFMAAVNPNFVLPYRGKLAGMLNDYAKRIQQGVLASLNGEIVSILVDGATKVFKKFEGVILYTHNAIHFFATVPLISEKAATLSSIVGTIVRTLVSNNISVASVCADNASNNRKAFNCDEKSAQKTANYFFYYQHCGAHSINLALSDVFGLGSDYHIISVSLEKISVFLDGPKISERWNSLYIVADFVTKNMSTLGDLFSDTSKKSSAYEKQIHSIKGSMKKLLTSLGQVSMSMFTQVLEHIWHLIEYLEGNFTSIADIFIGVFSTLTYLKSLPQITVIAALRKAITERTFTTLNMDLPLFAFLLTKDGHTAYKNAGSLQWGIYENAMNGLHKYLKERANFTGEDKKYLEETEFPSYRAIFLEYLLKEDSSNVSYEYWRCRERDSVSLAASFSRIAQIILTIPASEAAVERLFSHLGKVYTQYNSKMSPITINSRLIIKMHNILKPVSALTKDAYKAKTDFIRFVTYCGNVIDDIKQKEDVIALM